MNDVNIGAALEFGALAVFHDHGGHWICRFLKPGFRHAFVCVRAGEFWIMFDPRAGVPVLEVVAETGFDLARFYRQHGFTVTEIEPCSAAGGFPLMSATCVGVIKRILGIRSPLAQTPWGLYRQLIKAKAAARRPIHPTVYNNSRAGKIPAEPLAPASSFRKDSS